MKYRHRLKIWRQQRRIYLLEYNMLVVFIIIIIIRHAPCQCVAPLATNSLHSDLSNSILKGCAEIGRSSKWLSRRCRGAQLACSNCSDEHQSESSWCQLSRPFWPRGQTTLVSFSVWYPWGEAVPSYASLRGWKCSGTSVYSGIGTY